MVKDGWLERDGLRLHYVEWTPEGAPRGPALLLLHGLSANALYWSRLAAHLPARRLVALDQRSHGQSDRPGPDAGAYLTERLVEDTAYAIAKVGLDRPVVLGHSWGARIALELAATQPELVSGLGFIDGPAAPMSARLSWEDASRLMQPPLPRYRRRRDAAEHVRPWLKEAWADDLQAYAEASTVFDGEAWVLTLTAPVRLEILREMYAAQPQLQWAVLEVPSLVALAAGDEMVLSWKRQGAALVESLAPDAKVRWYDSSHDIPLIRPAQLAGDVENLCLRSAWRTLAGEISRLDGQWRRSVDESDWTARDLLAHLASTVTSLSRLVAQPMTSGGARRASEPFDSDRWNASQVRRRRERSPDQLQAEVVEGTVALEAAIAAADLSAETASGPYAGLSLADALQELVDHQRRHLADLRQALG